MADENSGLEELFKEHAGSLSLAFAFGTFLLYASGHLAQRFYLQVLGIDADIPIVNEGALFLGASYVFYFILSLPYILLALAPFVFLRKTLRKAIVKISPQWLTLLTCGFSIAAIQLVGRHVFLIRRVLLHGSFEPEWLCSILLAGPVQRQFLFVGLTLACLPAITWAWMLIKDSNLLPTMVGKAARILVFLLAGAQVLLLPVYFGTYTALGKMPRVLVQQADGLPALPTGTYWKLYTDATFTYFLIESGGSTTNRRILAVKTDNISTLEILDYDELVKRVCDK